MTQTLNKRLSHFVAPQKPIELAVLFGQVFNTLFSLSNPVLGICGHLNDKGKQ